jgi:hypothetical protein
MIIFVSDSGRCRKSTAIRLSREFTDAAGIRVIKGKSSPEAFLRQLSPQMNSMNDSTAFLVISELSVFLSKQTYTESLIDLLTDLADADEEFEYTTNKYGVIKLIRPCVTMLAATTPIGLGENIPAKAHSTGFMSRVLYVYAHETDRCDALTDVEDKDIDQESVLKVADTHKHLLDRIEVISKMAGPFTYTPEAREWYKTAYKEWVSSPQGSGEGYPSRRMEHLLRVAMVYVVTNSDDLVLDVRSLKAADLTLKQIEVDFPSAFAYIGNTAAKDRDVIINALRQSGGQMYLSKLYGKIYRHFSDIEAIAKTLNILTVSGVIFVISQTRDGDKLYSISSPTVGVSHS